MHAPENNILKPFKGSVASGFSTLMNGMCQDKKPFTLTCITRSTRKSESQCVILVGRSNWNILYLSQLCQTLSNPFSTSRKVATTCSLLLKLSMMDWNSLNRWKNPIFSRWDLSLCSITLSNRLIIELIKLIGL